MTTPLLNRTTSRPGDGDHKDRQAQLALHWICGQWVGSGSVDESRSPSNGDVVGRAVRTGAQTPEVRSRALIEIAGAAGSATAPGRADARARERQTSRETTQEVGAAANMLRHSAASAQPCERPRKP